MCKVAAKILFVISGDIYVRNYLRTDALSKLSSVHNVSVIASSALALKQEVMHTPGFRGFFDPDPHIERRHQLLFSLLMWRNRRLSPTFFYRWMRNSHWDTISTKRGPVQWFIGFLRWIPGALINPAGLRIPLLGNRMVFPFVKKYLENRLPVNPSIESLVRQELFDLIVYPSAAFDAASVDLARLGHTLQIPTLCLVDNWDNLTSKTTFWAKPDYLGVWGEQAREQACRIHSFPPDRVHPIGNPRFDEYFQYRNQKPLESYAFPYLLFVGSAMPFDELGAIHLIESLLARASAKAEKLTIVYRPHPWQQKRLSGSEFRESDFRRTILDRQISEAYASGVQRETTDTGFQPDLSYYPSLLSGATAVVGPLTTMLLEAALSLRPVVGLSYDDGIHENTTRRYFSHFEGVENIPGFAICESQSVLEEALLNVLGSKKISPSLSDSKTRFFVHQDEFSYSTRLLRLVDSILDGGEK